MKEDTIEKEYIDMEYMTMLYVEFCKSQGLKIGTDEKEFFKYKEAFSSWIAEMYKVKGKYADLLSYMISDSRLIAELGKGKYDSVAPELKDKGLSIIAITPYIETLKSERIKGFDGKVRFYRENRYSAITPIIKYEDPLVQKVAPNIVPCDEKESIDTLITHLPISEVSLKPLIKSSGQSNDIAIGFYGLLEDKNIEDKIRELLRIKVYIEDLYCVNCEEERITENGMYLHILKSKQKQLVLRKGLHR